MSDYDKRTALHLAAAEGHIETVKFLVNIARVKVDPRDRLLRFAVPAQSTIQMEPNAQGRRGIVRIPAHNFTAGEGAHS